MNTSYLLSSALSTTVYAAVSQIESATSAAEVDAVCRRELDRIRRRLDKGKGRTKDFDIIEAVVLLLFIENHRTAPVGTREVDFALVHALNLAEGGETLKNRSLGYLWLGLNLRPEDELSLLHVNSIVKASRTATGDLGSSHVGAMVHALRAVVHAPSADLAPAVQRQILHLVSHKAPVVRRLALAALGALSGPAPDALEGLCERKIWKRLRDGCPSVLLQAVKVLRKMTEYGFVDRATATRALLQALESNSVVESSEKSRGDVSLLTTEVLEAIGPIREDEAISAGATLKTALQIAIGDRARGQALVLLLARRSHALSSTVWTAVRPLLAHTIKTAALSVEPNDTYFALRSLEALSVEESGQILSERSVMERLTAALQSEDAAIRKMALRILGRLSAELPATHLDRLVQALARADDGLDTLAIRAVEVAAIIAAPLSSPRRGEAFAASVARIAAASDATNVLESTIQHVLEWLEEATSDDRASFTDRILAICLAPDKGISRTLALLVCAVFCLFGSTAGLPLEDACRVLTSVLQSHDSATLHQAALVSLAGVCATVGDGRTPKEVSDAVAALRTKASRHVRGRCDVFLRVAASTGGWAGLRPLLTDLSLPAVLQVLMSYARSLPELDPSAKAGSSQPAVLVGGGGTRGASSTLGLRYEAYPAAPTSGGHRGERPSKMASGGRRQQPSQDRSLASDGGQRSVDSMGQSFQAMARDTPTDEAAAADELWSPFESSPVAQSSDLL